MQNVTDSAILHHACMNGHGHHCMHVSWCANHHMKNMHDSARCARKHALPAAASPAGSTELNSSSKGRLQQAALPYSSRWWSSASSGRSARGRCGRRSSHTCRHGSTSCSAPANVLNACVLLAALLTSEHATLGARALKLRDAHFTVGTCGLCSNSLTVAQARTE